MIRRVMIAYLITVVQLPLLEAAASAQSIGSVDAVVVFDANGKRVGELGGRDELVHLELSNHSIVSAQVDSSGFESRFPLTYHVTSDCSGTTYAAADPFSIVPQAIIGPPGKTLYQVDTNASSPVGPIRAVDCLDPVVCPSFVSGCSPCLPVGTVAADTPAGSSTLTLIDASAFPESGNIDIAVGSSGSSYGYSYSMKTGNTLELDGPLAVAVPAGTTVTQGNDPCVYLPAAVYPVVSVVDLNTLYTPPFHGLPASAASAAACCGDCNGDGKVRVNEIVTAVNSALNGCPAASTSLLRQ